MGPIYRQIAANKRRTIFFFLLYATLFAVIGYFIGLYLGEPIIGFILAALAFIIIFLVSYYGGQGVVNSMAGSRAVSKQQEPFLYNTVDALSIAAGKPMPKLYIIETEVPNAFASGRNPENASITVTRGLMNRLNRQELEGVIAHEMAHINNFDVLLATVAVVLAGTIVFLGVIARRMYFFGGTGRSRRSSQSQLIAVVALIVLAVVAPLFAQLLKFAISRQREYLADATAADFTGYPEGLASALEKITAQQVPKSPLENKAIEGLYIINPSLGAKATTNRASILFSTHPPTEERIKRLRAM
ncbi:MAG: M48 family metallopeptidase [Bacillota bacterium]|nr:M48 family metallopeptidase [Bacillota bacterium]